MNSTPYPERNAEIIRRRKAGEWPRVIARDLGLSHNAVIGVCNRAGLCSRDGYREVASVLTVNDVRAIRAKVAAGEKQAQIAQAFGLHPTTVRKVIQRKTWVHVA